MSSAMNELWNEFYTTVGPVDAEAYGMLQGSFYSGCTSMLEHLLRNDGITKSSLKLVVTILEELDVPPPDKLN